jgi:hypothetical protein
MTTIVAPGHARTSTPMRMLSTPEPITRAGESATRVRPCAGVPSGPCRLIPSSSFRTVSLVAVVARSIAAREQAHLPRTR